MIVSATARTLLALLLVGVPPMAQASCARACAEMVEEAVQAEDPADDSACHDHGAMEAASEAVPAAAMSEGMGSCCCVTPVTACSAPAGSALQPPPNACGSHPAPQSPADDARDSRLAPRPVQLTLDAWWFESLPAAAAIDPAQTPVLSHLARSGCRSPGTDPLLLLRVFRL